MSKENINVVDVGMSYWELERIVAWSFNRLKGKLYNLIESTSTNETQCEAMKGLIKGFSNDEYKLCVKEMRYTGRVLKILGKGEDAGIPEPSEPLENKNGIFS